MQHIFSRRVPVSHPETAHILNRFGAIIDVTMNEDDFLFEDWFWCEPVDTPIPQDLEEIIAQRTWEDFCSEQAQRQAEYESFAGSLKSPGFCSSANARGLMVVCEYVAITRIAPLVALLSALGRIARGIWLDSLTQTTALLAARRIIPYAAPSGRSIPSDCLTPRLVAQRPQTARATRAVLMR